MTVSCMQTGFTMYINNYNERVDAGLKVTYYVSSCFVDCIYSIVDCIYSNQIKSNIRLIKALTIGKAGQLTKN